MDTEKFVVAKPFNTVNRRLQVGEVVTEMDLAQDSQMSFAERRSGRFVVGYETKAADKAAQKASEADAPIIAETLAPAPVPFVDVPAPDSDPPAEPEMKQPSHR